VELLRSSISAEAEGLLVVEFPGPYVAGEPFAMLSLASRGDMKFGLPSCAGNRERFLRGLGIEPERAFAVELEHTRNVIKPSRGDDSAAMARASGGADGILLEDPDLAATVTVADCMPIWILDRSTGSFGVLHSGWKGTGILESAVKHLVERRGSKSSSLSVVLGPAIGSCCYAVSEERAAAFSAEFGARAVESRDGARYLDLRAANIAIAERLGVGHLLSIDACTSCDGRLGSYRRQGAASFTRMLAVCGRSNLASPVGLAEIGRGGAGK
jgi:polyphenol oxidase